MFYGGLQQNLHHLDAYCGVLCVNTRAIHMIVGIQCVLFLVGARYKNNIKVKIVSK